MKKIFNVTLLVLFINSAAIADLSVNFSNQAVSIASGGTSANNMGIPEYVVPVGSLMQLIWHATGSELASENAFNDQVGLGKALDGEYILDEQVTEVKNLGGVDFNLGFFGPNTGVYSDADVGGDDINSGYIYLRAFDSAQGAVGGFVRDFSEVDTSAWVYNDLDTTTIYQGNLTGETGGAIVDIQDGGYQIQEAVFTTNNIYIGDLDITNAVNSAGYTTNFLSDGVFLALTNVVNIIGSNGENDSSDAVQVEIDATGFDAMEITGPIGILIDAAVTNNILGGNGATAEVSESLSKANASGGNGIVTDFNAPTRIFETRQVKIGGGDGGMAKGQVGSKLHANGGSAVIGNTGTYILDGLFTGGNAGSTELSAVTVFSNSDTIVIEAAGGHAVELRLKGSSLMPILSADTEFSGGDGGQFNYVGVPIDEQITNTVVNLNGGDGLHLVKNNIYTNLTIPIGEATFSGGNGGLTGIAVGNGSADGGHGLFIGGGQNLLISGGVFTGGNGGAISTVASGSASAQGGSGAYIKSVGIESDLAQITGGTFSGSIGGRVDGISEQDGYAIVLEDSHVELRDGVNLLDDLLVKTDSTNSTTIIQSGSFSDVYFSGSSANRSDFEIKGGVLGSLYLNDAAEYDGVITGGTFENITISGTGNHSLQIAGGNLQNVITTGGGNHDLRFGGSASIGDITFNNSGLNNLWLSNSIGLTTSGKLTVNEGELNVNVWAENNIQNIIINDAILNFNNSNFQSANQSSIELTHKNAHLNFNHDQAVISSGTELNLNSGTLSASNLVVESGSIVNISMSDKAGSFEPHVGFIDASETIDFKAGMKINIFNDGYTQLSELQVSESPSFSIANANVITSGLELEDVVLEGIQSSWLSGYRVGVHDNLSDDTRDFLVTFGFRNLKDEINATGDLAKLADVFQLVIENESEVHDLFAYTLSPESTAGVLTEGYFRAPEVANSLVGLQSVVRDQVAGRTRGYLKANRFGASAPSGPRGPDAGWWDRSMERINESLPKADLRGGLDVLNESLTKQSYYKRFMNWLNEKVPSFKPSAPSLTSDHKSWGKAYYSDLAQDAADGFVGYEAQVIGGIAGIDRKLNHGVLGWAAGYADTTILGNFEQNADVDTLHGTIYYTAATKRAYLDASMSYAYSLVESIGPAVAGGYTADYTASNLSFALGAGVGFTAFNDRVQVTPEFLFLSTLYDQEAYTETSAIVGMPVKQFSAYDDWSHKVELGATFSLLQILESTSMNLAIQPELRLHWLHEMNPNLEDQSYLFAGGQFSAALQAREENLLRTGLGIRFWDWADHRTEFSFDLDAITGSDYEEFTVSGSFIHRF